MKPDTNQPDNTMPELEFSNQLDLLEFSQKLLECITLHNEDGRKQVIGLLPSQISNRIDHAPNPLSHVFNMVKSCYNFERGLTQLLEAVYLLEDDSKGWQVVVTYLQQVAPGWKPRPKDKTLVEPRLATLVQTYIAAVQKQFEVYEDLSRLIPLLTRPGTNQPASSAAITRRSDYRRMQALLNPGYSAVSPSATLAPDVNRPPVAVEEYLAEKTRVALLGAPGAGKSTTLRRLFHLYAAPWQTESDFNHDLAPIPIFALLNQWQNPQMGLLDFLKEQIAIHGVPELVERLPELLRQGHLVLLLDGLNEIPQLSRDEKSGVINDLRVKVIAELGEKIEWRWIKYKGPSCQYFWATNF